MVSSCTYFDCFLSICGRVCWAEMSVDEKFSVPTLFENDGKKFSQDFYLEKFGCFTIKDDA